MKYGAPEALGVYAWRYTRQRISTLRPGWSLEYIDGLSVQDIHDVLGYDNALARARK